MSASWDQKSPVERVDYEGLQLDTRAKDSTEKHLNPLKAPQGLRDPDDSDNEDDFPRYVSEKQAAVDTPAAVSCPTTSTTSTTAELRGNPIPVLPDDIAGSNPESKVRRTCGMRHRHFWIVFGIVCAIIISAAVIGGAVGGTRHSSSASSKNSSGTSKNGTKVEEPGANNGPLQYSDVIMGSPLSVISYEQSGNSSLQNQQTFRIYYQSTIGNIKEAISNGSLGWQNATPIFTDAVNNTGLAVITYLNGSDQQASIFYVGRNRLLEKRKKFDSKDYWEPGSLVYQTIPAIGNMGLSSNITDDDLTNGWHRYRMAAVYSENFHDGPGCRLFYHTGSFSERSNWVQELIWNRKKDSWTIGNKVTFEAVLNSHLSATIDQSTRVLRLFYSTGDSVLQESWLDISDPNGQYIPGFNLPQFLDDDFSDIATVSDNGTSYLYHYTRVDPPGIRELSITGQPGSADSQETINKGKSPVSVPNLTSPYGSSPYQPLTATKFSLPGLGDQLHVFWADGMTGSSNFSATESDARSGYSHLWQVSRPVADGTWPANSTPYAVPIPLGDINSF